MESVAIETMTAPTEQKEVKVEIRLPQTGFPRTMYFNRLHVEREKEFTILRFGLMSENGMLLDQYQILVHRQAIENHKNSLLTYLNRAGQPKDDSPKPWQSRMTTDRPDLADGISMSYRGDLAETTFWVFSMHAATQKARLKTAEPVDAQPVVLLRSAVETQKQLIAALYEA